MTECRCSVKQSPHLCLFFHCRGPHCEQQMQYTRLEEVQVNQSSMWRGIFGCLDGIKGRGERRSVASTGVARKNAIRRGEERGDYC